MKQYLKLKMSRNSEHDHSNKVQIQILQISWNHIWCYNESPLEDSLLLIFKYTTTGQGNERETSCSTWQYSNNK